MKQRQKPSSPLARGEKNLIAASTALVALVLGGVVFWQRGNEAPVITIPPRSFPSPNAYDFYSRASTRAIHADPLTGASADFPSAITPLADRLTLVKANQAAFDLLHQGFAYPILVPRPLHGLDGTAGRWESNVDFPEYARLRGLARVLLFSAQARAEQGDYRGAWDYGLDSLRLGTDLSHGGPLSANRVGISIEAIGRRPLWGRVDTLQAPDARACARRLERIEDRRTPFPETMREEKYTGQTVLADLFKSNTLRIAQEITQDATGASSATPAALAGFGIQARSTLHSLNVQMRLTNTGKRGIYNDYTNYLDRQIAAVGAPYSAMPPLPPPTSDPLTAAMALPDIREGYFRDTATRMENELLLTALALRAYQLEHRDYPATLNTLITGGYLTRIPTDPFAPQAQTPLCYRRESAHCFLLYSRGADGKDDAGKPVYQEPHHYWLLADQKGDFVYAVSTYPR